MERGCIHVVINGIPCLVATPGPQVKGQNQASFFPPSQLLFTSLCWRWATLSCLPILHRLLLLSFLPPRIRICRSPDCNSPSSGQELGPRAVCSRTPAFQRPARNVRGSLLSQLWCLMPPRTSWELGTRQMTVRACPPTTP